MSSKKSKKSKKKSGNRFYKKINYKLSQDEIDTLLDFKETTGMMTKKTEINKKQKIIINNILNKIEGYENKYITKSFKNIVIQLYKLTNKKKNTMTRLYKDKDCCPFKIKKSINIFLDINNKLINNGAELFYSKKDVFNRNPIIKKQFIPKTGDIITFDSNIYHGQSTILEKNIFKKKKNRYHLEILLGSTKKKSKKK